ncbi:helix-turn-helix domain-containing protein [Catellatospora bangladeshensis]|uniref:helix-turn-helix domain-containing protein n=1 Tax=Catellatospora bangladeshensis TaxID=310355 RepID=UPI001944EA2E|nr:helix-turn-helix domain-containing protein [Catellatospora bangladeshensis]
MKLIRESLDLTQAQLAEVLNIDLATVQGWESGRRPVTSLRVSDLAALRARLIHRGANPQLFDVLRDAIEADLVMDSAIQHGAGEPIVSAGHPLAATVHRRNLTNLITWTLTGSLPSQLCRPGEAQSTSARTNQLMAGVRGRRAFTFLRSPVTDRRRMPW